MSVVAPPRTIVLTSLLVIHVIQVRERPSAVLTVRQTCTCPADAGQAPNRSAAAALLVEHLNHHLQEPGQDF